MNVDEAFLRVTKKLMEKKDVEEENGGGPKKIAIRGKNKLFNGTTKKNDGLECCGN